MINRISSPTQILLNTQAPPTHSTQSNFSDLFQRELDKVPSGVAFSKHAITRAEERGIAIDEALLTQLSDSVERAQAKGAKNILAFDNTRAFIVNVPNGRVITAMSQEEMKENIFTNIDGAVIL